MMLVLGVALGCGLCTVRHALRPIRVSDLLLRYGVTTVGAPSSLRERIVREIQQRSKLDHADIALNGTTSEAVAARRLVFALLGTATPLSVWIMTSLAGSPISPGIAALIGLGCCVLGFQVPANRVRRIARINRRRFRTALSAYLDLVSIMLAGGAGIETALHAAARVGDGPTFDAIGDALELARTTRRSPWDTLSDTGRKFGVEELPELAATVQLGGEHGARMTSSLVAKASSLRSRELADVEARANEATEKMGLPMVLLFIGFLLLLGYPAMHLITTGFEG